MIGSYWDFDAKRYVRERWRKRLPGERMLPSWRIFSPIRFPAAPDSISWMRVAGQDTGYSEFCPETGLLVWA